jgi:hypothetical protein
MRTAEAADEFEVVRVRDGGADLAPHPSEAARHGNLHTP